MTAKCQFRLHLSTTTVLIFFKYVMMEYILFFNVPFIYLILLVCQKSHVPIIFMGCFIDRIVNHMSYLYNIIEV